MEVDFAGEKKSTVLGPKEYKVLKTLLMFTVMMLVAPIVCFFSCKTYICEGILGYENGAVGGAIAAIVVVHIIIGFYIWLAISEERRAEPQVKLD